MSEVMGLGPMHGPATRTYVRPETCSVVVETHGGEGPNFEVSAGQLRNMIFAYFRYQSTLDLKQEMVMPNGQTIEVQDSQPIMDAVKEALGRLCDAAALPKHAADAILDRRD